MMIKFLILFLLFSPFQEIEKQVFTAQQFGAIAGDDLDDTAAVQKAIYSALKNKARCELYGTLNVNRTIHIGKNYAKGVKLPTGFTINMDGGITLEGKGNCLVWNGPNNMPIVECNHVKFSQIKLNIFNPNKAATGTTGFLWHNENAKLGASNINEVSLNIAGCDIGLQLGDRTKDGYDSNIDDNLFPKLVFSECRHSLIIDSRAQDNNTIGYFHGGGARRYEDQTRDFVILVKRNGNGLKIQNGFLRVDKIKKDAAAIDIQMGSFSCDKLSIEGDHDDQPCLALRLGDTVSRNQCVIQNFYTSRFMRNSEGNSIETKYRSGVTFIGCNLYGNIKTWKPITNIGTVFGSEDKGGPKHGIVKSHRNFVKVIDMTLGTRERLGDITADPRIK